VRSRQLSFPRAHCSWLEKAPGGRGVLPSLLWLVVVEALLLVLLVLVLLVLLLRVPWIVVHVPGMLSWLVLWIVVHVPRLLSWLHP